MRVGNISREVEGFLGTRERCIRGLYGQKPSQAVVLDDGAVVNCHEIGVLIDLQDSVECETTVIWLDVCSCSRNSCLKNITHVDVISLGLIN